MSDPWPEEENCDPDCLCNCNCDPGCDCSCHDIPERDRYVHLLNSPLMPKPGTYELREVSAFDWAAEAREALDAGTARSSIGCLDMGRLLAKLVGRPVSVCRAPTELADGDVMLIARLSYRVPDPATKGTPRATTLEDLRYYRAVYRA